MRATLLALTLALAVAALPAATAQTPFCETFDPPMTGPHCPIIDDARAEVDEAADLASAIVGLVRDYAWENTENVRCIIIRALGGSC